MPEVRFRDEVLEVEEGANLRAALRRAGLSPHNGNASWFNCKGMGTCGTCAVRIEGAVSPAEPSARERWRLSFPPHRPERGLRLACQVRVAGDLEVHKLEGFWGQGEDDPAGR